MFPLWADSKGQQPNIKAALLRELSGSLGITIGVPDLMAYFAAIAAHPAYTARFQPHFVQPGLRFPMTADASLFREAIAIGHEVIWLHCFGERFIDPSAGRPKGAPRLLADERPISPQGGGVPNDLPRFPDSIDYSVDAQELHIGQGVVKNVPREVWDYEVSGKQILIQWFSYRRLDRSRPIIGDRRPPSPLNKIQPDGWLAEYTTELMNVLNVLGRLVKLEPRQAEILERICDGDLLDVDELHERGAFSATTSTPVVRTDERQAALLDNVG